MPKTLKDQDGRIWGPKIGCEGPILWKGSRVVYWDRLEGKYFDPTTDLYLSLKETEVQNG